MRIRNFLASIFLPIFSLGRTGAGGTSLKSALPIPLTIIPLTNRAFPFAICYPRFACVRPRCGLLA